MATSKSNKTTAAKDTTKNIPAKSAQTTVKAEEAKKAEPKKTEAKKAEPKAAEKPAAKATKTTATKAAPAAKKTTTIRTTKKTTRKTSKATIRKTAAAVDSEVFVQIYGQEFSQQEIMQKVVAAWEAEGKKISSIKRAKLYIKPEEGKAYYVVNEGLKNGSTGAVDL